MLNLDLSDVPENSYELLPPGDYYVICDDAEMKETKAGNGTYINATFRVLEGKHEGKLLWQMFTVTNPNEKAVQIGLGQIKSFLSCAGKNATKLENVLDLAGLKCDVAVKNKNDDYGTKAVISHFKPHVGSNDSSEADIHF